MKKILLTLLVLALFIGTIHGEDLYSSMKFGLHAKASGLSSIYDLELMGLANLSLGVTLHIMPQLALRPSIIMISMNDKTRDIFNDTDEITTSDSFAFGGGTDILYFFHMPGNISLYCGAGYKFISSNSTYYSSSTGAMYSESSMTYHIISVIVGTQYLFNKNFGFFIETGLNTIFITDHDKSYNSTTGDMTGEDEDQDTYTYFQMPVFGAVFYLN